MKNRVLAKAMLVALVLGVSALFGSLPTAQAGYIPGGMGAVAPQEDRDSVLDCEFMTPEISDGPPSTIGEEILSPTEVKAELDRIYSKETNRYSQLTSTVDTVEPADMRGIRYTDQMIIKFDSFETRDLFATTIQSGTPVNCLQTLPYIIVPKTALIFNQLVDAQGIVRIMDDMLLSAPEYQIYEQEDIVDELALYNSEGRIAHGICMTLDTPVKGSK